MEYMWRWLIVIRCKLYFAYYSMHIACRLLFIAY